MKKLILIFLFVCAAAVSFAQRETPESYIEKYKSLAISEMKRSGVPAAITLAQGILESECGNSDLVKRSNNHFGIKCKSNWTGPSVSHDDDAPAECFRAYGQAEESFRDHSDFLKNSPRYSSLFDLDPEDYRGWANGLKKAGYATNPKYANILIDYIDKYHLNEYSIEGMMKGISDSEYQTARVISMAPENVVPSADVVPQNDWVVVRINSLKAINASIGTSLLAIASRFHVKLSRLLEWNELGNDGILKKSQLIFLEKKRTEGERDNLVFPKDETLYNIAQSQGVMVSSLCAYNALNSDAIVAAGTVVFLKPGQKVASTLNKTDKLVKNVADVASLHTVEPKEGLYAISKKYGVSVAQLREWNHLADDNLQIGQKLIISQ